MARARAAGVEHIVLATSYLAEVFEPYFGDGSSLGLHLEYVTEEEPLGTGGALPHAAPPLRSGPPDPGPPSPGPGAPSRPARTSSP